MRSLKERILFSKDLFDKAFETLNEAVTETNMNQYVKDATIQRFEYTYETAWKLIKMILLHKGVDLAYPRDLFREAFSAGWIENPEPWEDMIEDRNMTSHTYKSRNAEEVYQRICRVYHHEFKLLQDKLTEVVDRDIKSS